MKSISKILSVGIAALITATTAQAAPVAVNVDASLEGLALPDVNQSTLNAGVIEFGWLIAGTTEAQIDAFFALGDLASIDTVFNQVGTISFSLGASNTFGNGLVFESINVVSDNIGDPAGFAAYKNPTTGAAGRRGFLWIRDSAGLGSATQMAFVDTTQLFPTANDTLGFTDFANTFGTDDQFSISPSDVWVGSIQPVQFGGGVDINGGSLANGEGLNGGLSVLETAAIVPEPTTVVLTLVGLAGIALRRRRNA